MTATESQTELTVWHVYLPGLHRVTDQALFMFFECGIADLEELVARLNEGQVVVGSKLHTQRTGETGLVEVVKRYPVALTSRGVGRIEVPHWRFVEYEAAP